MIISIIMQMMMNLLNLLKQYEKESTGLRFFCNNIND